MSELTDSALLAWIEKKEKEHKEALAALEALKKKLFEKKEEKQETIIKPMPLDLHWGC